MFMTCRWVYRCVIKINNWVDRNSFFSIELVWWNLDWAFIFHWKVHPLIFSRSWLRSFDEVSVSWNTENKDASSAYNLHAQSLYRSTKCTSLILSVCSAVLISIINFLILSAWSIVWTDSGSLHFYRLFYLFYQSLSSELFCCWNSNLQGFCHKRFFNCLLLLLILL